MEGFTLIDGLVALVIVLSAILAYSRGLVREGMARWREALFAFMLKNANGNLRFFNLPLNRVIELGTQVEM